ncbi:MAG TPA: D-amino acid aminotransferase [Steroidobacteraceae bacterium]|jgi:D-alanine transaminase
MADPLPVCHLNGSLLPLREARISPLDRSFLFGDGVYEVIAARRGRAKRLAAHLARLTRSLDAIRMRNPHDDPQWRQLIEALIEANGAGDQYVYLQVSRGAEFGRNHAPLPLIEPTVFAFCTPLPITSAETLERGIACITRSDTRWARCDIKTVSLLANVLLRQEGIDAGAAETILLRSGFLTDASSSTIYVVDSGRLCAPPNSNRLLPGTTRSLVEELADAHGIPHASVPVSEAQLRSSEEVWLSAATRGVIAVTSLDGRPVGDGRPGPLWRRMHELIEAWWAA